MTKVEYIDNYLNIKNHFYIDKNLETIEEVIKKTRIKDYLYYTIIAVSPVSRIKATFVKLIMIKTNTLDDILYNHYKLLTLDE